MPSIQFFLNEKEVLAEQGSTILEAAEQNGVEIPTLCHDPRLKPTAACRMCLVEVEGARNPMPACTTPLTENMKITTASDKLSRKRRVALELLLSDHYGDCTAPCKLACPAGIDIQGFIAYIANGEYKAALKLIKETNPLPLVCGRVCPRFCETKCRRNLLEGPVAINFLKRFVADCDIDSDEPYIPDCKPATGHKVAIVGGGPGGLTAAYYLAIQGHSVTLLDAGPKLGGMIRYGIPEYRLPKAILDREIDIITSLCADVRMGVELGTDFTIDSLKEEGFESIFLVLGAQSETKMRIDGEDMPGVVSGIGFLRDVILGTEMDLGKNVVVVGGGNTAIDAARTAVRMGAEKVTLVYRRSREEMPANDEEVEGAEAEGVEFCFLSNPVRVLGENGKAARVECIQMALGEPDSSGRRRPEPIEGSEFQIEVDTVIAAIGQKMDACGLDTDDRIDITRRGYISVDEETMQTSMAGVFSGGDCASGPATVVEAIGAARRATVSIDLYLRGEPVAAAQKPYNCSKGELDEIDVSDYDDVIRQARMVMPALEPEVRKNNFSEIELGFTEEMARSEAERCLACGCQAVFDCKLRQLATEYEVDDSVYAGQKHHFKIHKDDHPFILRDPNKCVLCGRCVRICNELEGNGALGYYNRGFETTIETAFIIPLSDSVCNSCGLCVSTCPTGAIVAKSGLPKSGPWEIEKTATTCPYCGVGCTLEIGMLDNGVVSVTSSPENPVNSGNLCDRGSFNPYISGNGNRVTTPRIRKDGELVEASWEEALAYAGAGLNRVSAMGAGGDTMAVVVSPMLTNEESYLAQKLARAALKTNTIGCLGTPSLLDGFTGTLGVNASTCRYNDILESDLLLVYGSDLMNEYPVAGLKVKEAVNRGSKLVVLSSGPTLLDPLAESFIRMNRHSSANMLRALLTYIVSSGLTDEAFIRDHTEGYESLVKAVEKSPFESVSDIPWISASKLADLATLYAKAQKPVILLNGDSVAQAEFDLLSGLLLATGNAGKVGSGVVVLRTPGNAQGLIATGVTPGYLPGYQPVSDSAVLSRFARAWNCDLSQDKGKSPLEILKGIDRCEIQGLVVVGTEALNDVNAAVFETPLFSVLIDTILPQTGQYPDVVLPAASFMESNGTYTNCENRVQAVRELFAAPAGKKNWQILSELSTAIGYRMSYADEKEIYQEIASVAEIWGKADKEGFLSLPDSGNYSWQAVTAAMTELALPVEQSA